MSFATEPSADASTTRSTSEAIASAQQQVLILLPVHNRRALTEQFIQCLVAQTFTNFKLILIDDGSTDGTADMTLGYLPDTVVLRGKGDWWWAGSLQQGIDWLNRDRVADDALILMINDDLQFGPDFLARGVRLMAGKPRTFLLAQFLNPTDGTAEENGTCADLRRLRFSVATSPDQINCLSTQGLFMHWKDAKAVGPFHPRLLPHYLSDYEYTLRAHRMGFKLETSPELLIDLNRDSTGHHQIHEVDFFVFLRKFFSIKSPNNPFYFSMFIFLACPKRWVLANIFRTWNHARHTLTRGLKDSIKHLVANSTVRS